MRALSFLIGLAVFTQMAVAEDSCMAMKDFYQQGGRLVKIKNSDPMHVISPVIMLDCGNVQCVANITVEGIVDFDGSLRDLKVTENTYTDKREERAAALIEWTQKDRYEPPMLNGKSVCVHQKWRHKYGTTDRS